MKLQSVPLFCDELLPPGVHPHLVSEPATLVRVLTPSTAINKPNYLIVPVERLSEFVAYIEILHDCASSAWTRPALFRGHADAAWPLIPSLMRQYMLHEKAPDSTTVEALEDDLLTEFERRALPWLGSPPQGPSARWRWAALAQHHNLPTRLLDWTYRPTTALFFAVGFEPPSAYGGFSCVWAIQSPRNYREVQLIHAAAEGRSRGFIPTEDWPAPQRDKNLPVCRYDPPHVSPRITVQQGCFTAHPSHYRRQYFDWIDGTRIIFVVHTEDRSSLKLSLERLGINREVMFPGLDGIAAHLGEILPPKFWPLHDSP